METLESALALMLAQVQAVRETEDIPLSAALGRVAAQEVLAPVQTPPFDRSPWTATACTAATLPPHPPKAQPC